MAVTLGSAAVGCSATSPRPVPIGAGPTAYHVVYLVEYGSGAHRSFATDEVWVRRPFDVREVHRAGRPPGGATTSLYVRSFDRTLTRQGGDASLLLTTPPGAVAMDLRLSSVLSYAVAHHLVRPGTVRHRLGYRCQVFRTAVTPGTGVLTPLPRSPASYTDSCVDDRGLLLEQDVVDHGRTDQRRIAVRVDTNPAMADGLFAAPGTPVAATAGGGFVRRLTADSRPPGRSFWVLSAPPRGFVERGRYAVVPPQPRSELDPSSKLRLLSGVRDVYTSGGNVVVVDQGGTLGGVAPFTPTRGAPTVRTPAGPGEVLLTGSETSVRVLLPPGRYVTVTGTVAPATLVALARTLRPQPGGHLMFAGGS